MDDATPISLIPLRESHNDPKDAGSFDQWLESVQRSTKADLTLDVPCGQCNGCCRSGYFIRVHRSETSALAAIPEQLLFPAPGENDIFVMGYDHKGRCPMLKANQCSIYDSRPLTCRTYDCRIFSGSGIDAGANRPAVNESVKRWRFTYDDQHDARKHQALMTAANFVMAHKEELDVFSDEPLHVALLALRCLPFFLQDPLPDTRTQLTRVKSALTDSAQAS
ncbi:MAG: YkgJ family cysteine cluster protein [Pseudomonadota bacterium]